MKIAAYIVGVLLTASLIACGGSNSDEGTTNPSRVTGYTVSDGSKGTYTYDSAGRLVESKDEPSSGSETSIIYTYNTDNQLTSIAHSNGDTTTYTYNSNGLVVKDETKDSSDDVTISTAYEYNASNQLQKENVTGSSKNNINGDDFTYSNFNSAGLPRNKSDGTIYTYNSSNQLVSVLESDGTDSTTYTYTSDGQLEKIVRSNRTETYTHEKASCIHIGLPPGSITHTQFHNAICRK